MSADLHTAMQISVKVHLKNLAKEDSYYKLKLMQLTNNHHTYFGTLVEDVRELPQYKDPSLMKEFNLADEGILPS